MSSLIAPEAPTFRVATSARPVAQAQAEGPGRAILSGFLLALAQLIVALGLLAPEVSLSQRYQSLIQHDSLWYKNIIERGYGTTVPPIDHKMMQVSNVGFFPAYPAAAAILRSAFNLKATTALLVTAQLAAWGFWIYFFLFCARWNISPPQRFLGALAIAAHPAAFFLIAGYSESLFLMALLGFAYWSTSSARGAKFWAVMHGIAMSGTRVVGIPCAAFPVVQSAAESGRRGWRRPWAWLRGQARPIGLMLAGTVGALLFFIYCQVRWGHWNIYMKIQESCWGLKPDYLAVFKLESYRWHWPQANYPVEASQLAMTLGGLFLAAALVTELIAVWRRDTHWPVRAGFYFCGAIIYYVSVSAVACVGMESMLRYEFCLHALIVLALLHFLRQFRNPPSWVRMGGTALVIGLSGAGLCAQAWYVWNFMRGNWVA